MNMPITSKRTQQIEAQLRAISAFKMNLSTSALEQGQTASLFEASAILDQHFALQTGSHKDVKEYVIYFNQLMAFFADGSHCGLEQSSQFVAYTGDKDAASSVVLKEDDVHVEVKRCTKNATDITIEFPSQMQFTARDGSDYFVE